MHRHFFNQQIIVINVRLWNKSGWKIKFWDNKYTRISDSESTNKLTIDSSLVSAVSEDPIP